MLVLDPGELAHDLADRPVGDALPVGEARAADDPGPCSDPRDELRHEARLTHARLADDRHQPALGRRESGSELPLEELELLSPAGERRPDPPHDRPEATDLDQAVGGDGLALSLCVERLHGLGPHRGADEAERRLSEQHLTRPCGLLQPRGDVDRIACHERLPVGCVAGHNLAGVDADPERDPRAEPPLEVLVQKRKPRLHLERGAARAQGVVLVCLGHAEHGQHGVPDELLDGAPVTLERPSHLVEVGEHQAPNRLRVDPLAHRRRARQIAEDERRELAPLRGGGREPNAAIAAVVEAFGILPTAAGADHSRGHYGVRGLPAGIHRVPAISVAPASPDLVEPFALDLEEAVPQLEDEQQVCPPVLRGLERTWDPENLLHLNHNIAP